jgi:hypothetical protein
LCLKAFTLHRRIVSCYTLLVLMNDLEIAKNELTQKNLTLAIIKNGQILFETKSNRISGFLDAIATLKDQLDGSSLADRVAGRAIALLCVYAKIKEVYAQILSRKAQEVLKQNQIHCQWREIVDNILDQTKTSICPFEKAAEQLSNPQEAYQKFNELRQKMKSCQT